MAVNASMDWSLVSNARLWAATAVIAVQVSKGKG